MSVTRSNKSWVADLPVIRMFWHGSGLSIYEKFCIRSFVRHGHEVEVYSYSQIEVPEGAVLMDAQKILPEGRLFYDGAGEGKGGLGAFSDLFRYKLLAEKGGIWADSDLLCMKPLNDLPDACVGQQDKQLINNALIKLPPNHKLSIDLYERASKIGVNKFWGQIGPHLITKVVQEYDDVVVMPREAFYPIHFQETWKLVTPGHRTICNTLTNESYTVHWWNEVMRRIGVPKSKLPPENSFLGLHALELLQTCSEDFWSESQVATWVDNFCEAEKRRRSLLCRLERRLGKS